jgi:hypothetical protein
MTRNNLAVVFSPVIFSLDYDSKKKLKSLKSQMLSNHSAAVLNKQAHVATLAVSASSNNTHFDQSSLKQNSIEQLTAEQAACSRNESISQDDRGDQRRFSVSAKQAFVSGSGKSHSQQSQEACEASAALAHSSKPNYIAKYSDKINKAASSIVSFGSELGSGSKSDSIKENLDSFEYMNKVVQMCVSDMIKYSMDLFTVPVENFEKLRLSVVLGSEPHNLDSLYDPESRRLKKAEFFASNVNIDKSFWSYFDKYEDVSIYYFKSEYQQQVIKTAGSNANLSGAGSSHLAAGPNSNNSNASAGGGNVAPGATRPHSMNPAAFQACLFIPQTNECFNDKLKLWKCCTLVKKPNLTLEKILTRLKSER